MGRTLQPFNAPPLTMVEFNGDLAITSLYTTATVVLLNVLGILLAIYPKHNDGQESGLITQHGIQICAKLVAKVLLPCLSLLNVSQIQDFGQIWPVAFWHLATIPINLIITYFLSYLLRIPDYVRPMFVSACGFANLAALTYVIMQALCDQPQLAEEPNCFDRASGFIAVSVLAWHLTFWTLGEHWLTCRDPRKSAAETESYWTKLCWLGRRLTNLNVLATLLGIIIANVPELQDIFFPKDDDDDDAIPNRPPLLFLTSAIRTLAESSVGLVTLVMAATIGKRLHRLDWSGWRRRLACLPGCQSAHETRRETVVFELSMDGSLPQTGHELENKVETRELDSELNGSSVVDVDEYLFQSSTLAVPEKQPTATVSQTERSALDQGLDGRFIPLLVVVRVLVLGTVQFILVYLVADHVFPASSPDAKLIKMMLYVQAFGPTANMAVVACQQIGLQVVAEAVALAVLLQQLVVAVVMLLSISIALGIVYA
eukprot:m.165627 g.165627  ORF g.165627 m.165627 type:complete len:486 (-) comp16600_c0_seq4:2094-3551(-)